MAERKAATGPTILNPQLESILDEENLINSCRICNRKPNTGVLMRPLFVGDRIQRIITNTIHLEVKNIPGLPQFICVKCLKTITKFSSFQVAFRRSEEKFQIALRQRENANISR